MQPDAVVSLVHGTYAKDAVWIQEGSALFAALKNGFGERLLIKPFRWSGENSIYARTRAAAELADHIRELSSQHPQAHQYIIAHSHGGNVALYCQKYLRPGSISGVACISTPFFQAKARDIAPFNRSAFTFAAVSVDAFLCLFLFNLLPSDLSWPWTIALFGLSFSFITILGLLPITLFLQVLDEAEVIKEQLVDAICATVPKGSNLGIVRVAGDEASLSLGTGQFLLWLVSRAFAWAEKRKRGQWGSVYWGKLRIERGAFAGLSFHGGKTPCWLRISWIIVGLSLLGILEIFSITLPRVEIGDAFGSTEPPKIAYIIFLLTTIWFIVPLIIFLIWKTRFFGMLESLLFGALMYLLFVGIFLAVFWLGTVPKKLDSGVLFHLGRSGLLFRWFIGVAIALLVEVTTEVTPSGSWSLKQLEPSGSGLGEKTAGPLVHSAYDDTRVQEWLVSWLSTSLQEPPL